MRRILPIGYDFLKQWEQGPHDDPNVRLTPEGAALDAYPCSANKWTIGFGCTFHINGTAVKKGDSITPEEVMPLLEHNLRRFEELVDGLLTSKASSLMFTAHVLFAFNIGSGSYRKSSALRESNTASTPTEWRNAVENFFLYTGVTTYSPSKSQLADRSFASKIGKDKDGDPVWVSPNGRPCGFMLRSRGLLKRHMGESIFALGYDWRQATTDSERLRIQITIRHPDTAYFDEGRNRWVSRVDMDETTDFDKVLAIAKDYPLDLSVLSPSALAESEEAGPGVSPEEAPEPVPETISKPVAPKPPQHKEAAPVAEEVIITNPLDGQGPLKMPAPPVDPPYGRVDTSAEPKDMTRSKRFWGMVVVVVARLTGGSTAISLMLQNVLGDEVLFDVVTEMAAWGSEGAVWAALFVVDRFGDVLHKFGKDDAKQLLK